MSARRSLGRVVAGATAAALLLSGCQFTGLQDLPLPGGGAGGGPTYHVTVEFRDVLDLVPQSSVKVNDVTVGSVEKVFLDGFTARVRLRLRDSVQLPDNAVAELRQTSLLGEKFVSLAPPPGEPPQGRLADGDVIPLARSGRNPEVEEVLAALSLLLNGGGVAQLKTINVELAKIMQGREGRLRDLLVQLDAFVGGLDAHKAEIVRAIEAVDRLSARLAAQKDTIAAGLDQIGPGLEVLADQRRQLTAMLTALSRLGAVGTRVVTASKDDTVANLRALAPILSRLAAAGDALPRSLSLLLTYPFPDTVLDAVKGDYTNLKVTASLDLREILGNLGTPSAPPAPKLPKLPAPVPTTPRLPVPPLPRPPSLPPLPKPTVPPVPAPPVPPVPGQPAPSPSQSCLPIVGCVGGQAPARADGDPAYDPDLAVLLVGGVV